MVPIIENQISNKKETLLCFLSMLGIETVNIENFNANKGLRYAVAFDGGEDQFVNINGAYRGELGSWQAARIIKTSTKHEIAEPGLR